MCRLHDSKQLQVLCDTTLPLLSHVVTYAELDHSIVLLASGCLIMQPDLQLSLVTDSQLKMFCSPISLCWALQHVSWIAALAHGAHQCQPIFPASLATQHKVFGLPLYASRVLRCG